ncbi:hypothetical protein GCM10011391_37710 [Pullulanibacillus camelliae]|uniref:NERD domain-containing protein n=1 Tax=Pullulanibacillus camelliae TaxID=1707096 RepID=A0A8J2YNG4_9BACL|nr:hypothetical protein [Pullulanibacillus camelliae]GGE55170.1 hypothetical protein GCM10011391_37710 [Pullulanibacillus camelliae]
MAQLVKIERCISRYSQNLYRYAGRFIHQKTRRFEEFKENYSGQPDEVIKEHFYKKFFKQQLIWATSTAREQSELPNKYKMDLWLRLFLRNLDDTVLVFYEPELKVGEAYTSADIILVTPFKVWTVKLVLGEKDSVFQPYDRRKWKEIQSKDIAYTINPLLSLQRTTESVRRIFHEHDIVLPLQSVLCAPESYIEFSSESGQVKIVDKTELKQWMKDMSSYRSTLKREQLHAAEVLLAHSDVVAEERV